MASSTVCCARRALTWMGTPACRAHFCRARRQQRACSGEAESPRASGAVCVDSSAGGHALPAGSRAGLTLSGPAAAAGPAPMTICAACCEPASAVLRCCCQRPLLCRCRQSPHCHCRCCCCCRCPLLAAAAAGTELAQSLQGPCCWAPSTPLLAPPLGSLAARAAWAQPCLCCGTCAG